MEYVVFGFIISLFLASLAPEPKSTVILLPDEDGKVGEVSVKNQTDTQTINTAYTAVQVNDSNSAMKIQTLEQEQVQELYQSTLSAKPDRVSNYILYFVSGSSELTEESKLIIPDIISDISSRKIYEVYAVGHTDTVGTDEGNHKLGLERANILKGILEKEFSQKPNIQVTSHGEGSLLVPTADNVNKSENRRVEIEIH